MFLLIKGFFRVFYPALVKLRRLQIKTERENVFYNFVIVLESNLNDLSNKSHKFPKSYAMSIIYRFTCPKIFATSPFKPNRSQRYIWVFHDRRFCQIIWQIFTQGRAKKFRQKLPPVGIETMTSRSSSQCLTNWAKQESDGQEISEVSFVCFMHHFTCWTLFISRINRAWLYKGHEDSGWQLNVDLAQLVRRWLEDPEVLVSNPTWHNFWWIFFCSSVCKDLSDNLTETPIVKNSIIPYNLLHCQKLVTHKSLTHQEIIKC